MWLGWAVHGQVTLESSCRWSKSVDEPLTGQEGYLHSKANLARCCRGPRAVDLAFASGCFFLSVAQAVLLQESVIAALVQLLFTSVLS